MSGHVSLDSRPETHTPGRLAASASRRIRVLIVDDSVVLRRLLCRILSEDSMIEVVGSARDGNNALEMVERLRPEVVTLDVEMPELDGMGALRLIRARYPDVKVIMCSSLTERGSRVTVDALLAGASDYVTKQQSGMLSESRLAEFSADLRSKIRGLFPFARKERAVAPPMPSLVREPFVFHGARKPPRILAIGVSTGGPSALAAILPTIPEDFPLPILIVQHMPPFFTKLLAERLSKLSSICVVEAENGMEVVAGCAFLAPGDFHMRLVRNGARVEISLDQTERENSCRPAVDVLFRSVAEIYGGAAVATVLTGMGQDGLRGARALKSLGATVLVQDNATSVVWGMPGAIAEANLADSILPLGHIIPEILRRTC